MRTPVSVEFKELEIDSIATMAGRIAVVVDPEGKLDTGARRVNRLCKGALARLVASKLFTTAKSGDVLSLAYPAGLAAEAIDVLRLSRRCSLEDARRGGANLAKNMDTGDVTLLAGNHTKAENIAYGVALRAYGFEDHKTADTESTGNLIVTASKPDEVAARARPLLAVAEGVFFTRDLVNEPANILTTSEFANRLVAMEYLGLDVEVMDEPALEALGMGSFLSVGQGSDTPTKMVVMRWNGGKKGDAPLALVGKGVMFDTGGISLKPAAGMEDMTMDMGGAGVVAGVMRALALRGAKANVVGLVGLVENMPSGNATRPGDVVKSMKGDTIEVINTDAEGRLVLCDVMWYAQEHVKPAAMIDLATLTGAIIIGLGHENAGVFSNDDTLCNNFLKAATIESEGAWRMPLGQAYDDLLKSRIADMKNIGGRAAGSITAAQFLQRFVQDGMPWIHLDIAGVASVTGETKYAPKGATGWGVMALDRLVADQFEKE
ncbi:MAG: leucyl aminopeptidase [Rhodobacterales bacterium]|nr:leucyl aminopeptidase [Rhodobacterales bacterium]